MRNQAFLNLTPNENMSQKRKVYDKKFRSKVALEAIREQMTVAEIVRKYKVNAALVTKWKKIALGTMEDLFEDKRTKEAREKREVDQTEELLKQIGRLSVENEFLKKKSNEFGF